MSSPGATWAGGPPTLPSLRGPAASLQLALLLRAPHPPSGCPRPWPGLAVQACLAPGAWGADTAFPHRSLPPTGLGSPLAPLAVRGEGLNCFVALRSLPWQGLVCPNEVSFTGGETEARRG